jgi:catechol 2,3-dioxygenase-like lactoylglutathione lyase family enzyme
MANVALVTVVVREYDKAIAFRVDALDFELREDTLLDDGKRWVVVAPADARTGLLLAQADSPEQRARVWATCDRLPRAWVSSGATVAAEGRSTRRCQGGSRRPRSTS